ncbi:PKD domain-containing protein [Aquimarina algiphila]|uniref:PKD domain-containing protein n=1 Tax=Aquimarina algiphila TaxID=2047982 RepID=UPI002490C6BC|nr:gliding motility-associated C-terminal domain-containing protein [Aquimarina algiphila]
MKQFYLTEKKKIPSRLLTRTNKLFLQFCVLLVVFFAGVTTVKSQSCTINAGLNQTICINDTMQLQGSSPDTYASGPTWSQTAGPTVIISDPTIDNPIITGFIAGNTYEFEYTAECFNGDTPSQTVSIVVNPITIADAGTDVASCPDNTGSIVVNGNSPGNINETGQWSIVGGNGAGVSISLPNSASTPITLSETNAGSTTLRWTITNSVSSCSSSSDITVTNYGGEIPVNAGPNQSLDQCYTVSRSTNLNGSFGGNNLNGQQGTWTFVSGPSFPSITNPNSANTNVSDLIEGTYTFRWNVVGPCATGSDTVNIVIDPATQDITPATIQDNNQRFCDASITETTLVGSTPDFTNETVEWNQTGGPPATIVSPMNSTTQITGLASPGDYTFTYTITNNVTLCTEVATARVRYNVGVIDIVVNSGNDIVAPCGDTTVNVPFTFTNGNNTQYSIIGGPSASAISFPTSYQNAVSSPTTINIFDVPGTYTVNFRRRRTGNQLTGCDEANDAINIIISAPPSGANAGVNQDFACGQIGGTLAGSPILPQELSVWSQVSGPNTATISDIYAQNPLLSGMIPGTYEFRYTVTAGPNCVPPITDEVIIEVSPISNNPVDAGPDQIDICVGANVELAANAGSAAQTGTWTGPPGITFSDINDPNAVASGFSSPSTTYTLTWSLDIVDNTACTLAPATDTVDITTSADISPTAAAAGVDQCLAGGTTNVSLSGNAPATTPNPEEGLWTVSPAAGVTFAPDATQPNAVATVPSDGVYIFTWTIQYTAPTPNGCASTSDDVQVVIADTNLSVSAGPDQELCLDPLLLSFDMNATPAPAGGTGTWNLVSGGQFSVDDENSPTATFSNLLDGTYVFEWVISFEDCPVTSPADQVTIVVGIPPTVANIPAGDQVICATTNAVITADPLLNPITESGVWSLVSGPNTPSIDNPSNNNINVSGLTTGTYVFNWTVTSSSPISSVTGDPLCPTSSQNVMIDVYAPSSAGPDQDLCEVTSVFLEATPGTTGTWTQVANGAPVSTINQSSPGSNTANASVIPGNTYEFQFETNYTTPGDVCNNTDTVIITISDGPSVDPIAGTSRFICSDDTTSITLAGSTPPADPGLTATWSILEQPSGTASIPIGDINNPNATLNGLSEAGVYILQWNYSIDNCTDKASIVRIEVFGGPISAGSDQTNACQEDTQLNATLPEFAEGTWSFANPGDDPSGGVVVINDINNPQTILSNVPGDVGNDGIDDIYVLTWTVSYSNTSPFTDPVSPNLCDPQSDTVTLTFTGVPPTPADAGPDQNLCDETQTFLNAVPLASGTGTWTQTGGPAGPIITAPNNPNSLVIDLAPETYEFTWTTVGGGCTSTDIMEVTVVSDPIIAEAGPDQNLPEFSIVTLGATAASPPSVGRWTQVSGPNVANIDDNTNPNSNVTSTIAGTYIFEWTVTNGSCDPRSDQVTIVIIPIVDLELSKSVLPAAAKIGETVTFTVAITNNNASGSSDATGVEVVDIIPAGYSLVPGTVSNSGLYNAGNLSITWSGVNVPNGTTVNLTFDATVNATGPYNNSAQITASNEFDPDSTPNNDVPGEDDQDEATITITPNDPPVAVNDQSLNNTLGDPVPVIILNNDSDSDGTLDPESVDLDTPVGATSIITDLDGDVIGFTVPGEGSWAYDDDTGELTFSPEPGFTGNPTDITYTVRDDSGNTSNVATVNIEYTFTPPVANDDTNLTPTPINDPTILNIINNDLLADGSTPNPSDVDVDLDLTTPGIQNTLNVPTQGDWVYTPGTGQVTFTPVGGFTNSPTPITYELTDLDNNQTDTALITIVYQQPPVANDDQSLANAVGTTVNLPITTNDNDPDGLIDPATVNLIPPGGATGIVTDLNGNVIEFIVPGEGTWSYNGITGLLSFSPETGYTGNPTDITYTVRDDDGNLSNVASINIEYTPTPPIANDDTNTVATPIGNNTDVSVLDNDTLGDGSTPDVTDVSIDLDPGTPGIQTTLNVPGQGDWTYSPVTGIVTFDPIPAFTGNPTPITYELTDLDNNQTDTALITVIYQQPPVADNDDSLANTVGTTVTVPILNGDTDPDGTIDPTSVNLTTPGGATNVITSLDGDVIGFTVPGEGVWLYNETTGGLSFDPVIGFTGNPTDVTYTVDDNDGNTSNLATVNIEYTPTPPVANDDTNAVATVIGNNTDVSILDNDTLADGTTPDVTDVSIDLDPGTPGIQTTLNVPGQGDWTYSPVTGIVTFDPIPAFTGNPTPITYELTDLDNNQTDTALITVIYQIPPVADDDDSLANTAGDTVNVPILTGDTDADGTIDPTTVDLTTPGGATNVITSLDGDVIGFTVPGEGVWSYDETTGQLSFDPQDGFTGNPTDITYTVDDNDGNTSNLATVNIEYTPTPPVANDDTNAVATVIGNNTDVSILDNDTLADGTTPDVTDVSIDLDPGTPGIQTTLNVPGQGDWTYSPVTGIVTFDPIPAFTGNPTPITYELTDLDNNQTDTALITVIYQIPPVADDDDSLANTAGDTVNVPILTGDTDADGTIDPMSVNLTTPVGATNVITDLNGDVIGFTVPGEGIWSYNEITGELSFDPQDGFTGNPTDITYTVDDNDGNTSNLATVNIEYTPTPPVPNDDNSSNNVTNNSVTLNIINNDVLADGSTPLPTDVFVDLVIPITATSPVIGANFTTIGFTVPNEGDWLYNEATGQMTFTPEAGFTGDPTPIDYNIIDSDNLEISVAPATITIDYAIQPPVAVDNEDLNNTPGDTVDITILTNDSDPDGTLDPNGVNLIPPAGATGIITDGDGDVTEFTVTGEGTWTYNPATQILSFDPDPGFITDPTPIFYTVDDNDGNPSNQAEVRIDYLDVADLSLIKRVVDNDITPFTGTEITFEVRVTNDGPALATGVSVTDLLPNGYDFVLYSSTAGVYDETTGIWNIGTIPSGDTETLLIDVLVNETGNYTNVAQVTASGVLDLDSTPNNNILAEDDQDEVVVTPVLTPRIDLSVTKVADDLTPNVGGTITFTMTVTNDGPSNATNVVVTDLLASGYQYVSSTVTVGTYEPLNGSWTIGNLANSVTQTLTITANVLAMGDYTNVVEVTDATENDIDSTPANNDDTEDDQVTIEPIPISVSDLRVTKSVNNATPQVGSDIQFTILLENLGLSSDRNIVVTDLLPTGYTFVSYEATAGVYDDVSGLWTVNRTLIQGDIERLTITATVNPTGVYTNIAEITASDNLATDPNIPNNTSTIGTTPIPVADLSLAKTVNNTTPDVTDNITFTLTLTNDGPSEATGVVVTDPIPSGFNWISDTSGGDYNSGTGLWTIGNLGIGATTSIDITVSINTLGNYTNVAEVTAVNELDPDSTPNNDILAEDDQEEVQVFPRVITDISVTKAVDVMSPAVGDQITFTITITNDGPSNATGIVVEDVLASGYMFDSANPSVGIYDETIGSWDIGNLANGITETLTITVTVLPTGSYSNTAELIALDTFDPDSNPDNNVDSEDDQDTVNPMPSGLADLSIEKVVNNATPLVGDTVEFVINVTNSGDSNATGVEITDQLPIGYTFVSFVATAGLYNSTIGIWSINGTILNGTTESLIILATVNEPTNTTDEYINIAEITRSDQADPDSDTTSGVDNDDFADGIPDDDESTVVVTPQFVDIGVDKIVSPVNVTIGEEVMFTITATNNSNTNVATNVQIQDVLPTGYRYVSSSASSGDYNQVSGLWIVPTVNTNETETLTITAEVLDIDDYINVASLFDLDQFDINTDNDSGEAFVVTQCLTVFNEFSPNNDGVNDTFSIDCISQYPDNRLEIYNRWGNIVFEKDGYDNSWDGTSNGRAVIYVEDKLPVGTYYYILDLGDGTKPKAGWVYLNR